MLAPLLHLACTGTAAKLKPTADGGEGTGGDTGDAGADDAGGDAGDEGPLSGEMTLTVLRRSTGAPEQSVTFLFYDADGNLLDRTASKDDGKTQGKITRGGQVSVVQGTSVQPRILTIQGVAPNDDLTVYDEDEEGRQLSFKVTPPAAAYAGAATMELVVGRCSTPVAGKGSIVTIDATCFSHDAASTLFLRARNASNQPIAAAAVTGVTLRDDTPVPVSFGDWTATDTGQTVSASGVPTAPGGGVNATQVRISHHLGVPGGSVFNDARRAISGDATFASGFSPLPVPGATFQQDEVSVLETLTDGTGVRARGVAVRGGVSTSSSIVFDGALPRITGANVTGTAVPSVTFTSDGDLAGAKAFVIDVRWSTSFGVAGEGLWRIVVPASATTVKPALLPPTVEGKIFAPLDPDAWLPVSVIAFGGASIRDYAAFRASGLLAPTRDILAASPNAPAQPPSSLLPILPGNGTVSFTALVHP